MRALVTPVAWARVLNARVLMVDYRLAPMIAKPPTGGDSAGGNLTVATLHRLKAANHPLPACAIAISPLVDFTSVARA